MDESNSFLNYLLREMYYLISDIGMRFPKIQSNPSPFGGSILILIRQFPTFISSVWWTLEITVGCIAWCSVVFEVEEDEGITKVLRLPDFFLLSCTKLWGFLPYRMNNKQDPKPYYFPSSCLLLYFQALFEYFFRTTLNKIAAQSHWSTVQRQTSLHANDFTNLSNLKQFLAQHYAEK